MVGGDSLFRCLNDNHLQTYCVRARQGPGAYDLLRETCVQYYVRDQRRETLPPVHERHVPHEPTRLLRTSDRRGCTEGHRHPTD